MKIREHIDLFRLYLSDLTNRPSDDITYPNKQIYAELLAATNTIVQQVEKKEIGLIAPTICLNLKEVDFNECPCAPASGCTYMKSKETIPDFLYLPKVNFADSSQDYIYIEWDKFKHHVNSRIKGTREGAYYTFKKMGDEQHLYIYHLKITTNLKTVQVTGIPLDPIKFQSIACNGSINADCNPMDINLVIPDKYRNNIFSIIAQKIGATKALQGSPDIINNDLQDSAMVKTQ